MSYFADRRKSDMPHPSLKGQIPPPAACAKRKGDRDRRVGDCSGSDNAWNDVCVDVVRLLT